MASSAAAQAKAARPVQRVDAAGRLRVDEGQTELVAARADAPLVQFDGASGDREGGSRG